MIEPKKKFRRPIDFIEAASAEEQPAAAEPIHSSVSAVAVDVAPVDAHLTPWDRAHPKMRVGFAMRLPEALHLKLVWLAGHIPNQSMHSLALAAIEQEADRLIAEHYK